MGEGAKSSIDRVRDVLLASGLPLEVKEFPASTRTAEDAARAIGCTVAQIVKSLIFKGKESGEPVLVLASGVNRVNEKQISKLIGQKIGRADADFVRAKTGFAIGGVAPVGHINPARTLIDEDLLQHEIVWAAAGKPNAVFRLKPNHLVELTGGTVVEIAQKG